MKKILIEASVLEQDRPSGVNYFTDGFSRALEENLTDTEVSYFWLNFLGKKSPINPLVKAAFESGRLQQIKQIPQRVYAKLVFYRIAPPLFLKDADWVIYPNFYVWPSVRKAKRAVVIHDLGYLRHPEYVEDKNQKFLSRVVKDSVKKADMILSISEFTSNEMQELLGVNPKKITTITIPVDTSQLNESFNKGPERLAERYGINKPYILSLGTLEPRKNLSLLIEAYCELPKEVRDTYSLVLAGKLGWKTESLKELIETKQAEGYDIITTGHIDHDDKSTFYYSASAFAMTTHYEGFGMPLLEAMYCGVPSVAVDIPVLNEVGGDACIWVEKDPVSVANGLETILTDAEKSSALSAAGKERAAQFSWKKVAETIDKALYDR
jgi:glycosyltransferase involved in cell wall biosynthesis